MAKTKKRDMMYPGCPIRHILARFSDKWSVLVLFLLNQHDVMRFNSLRKNMADISQKMLAVTLRTLEEDGLVNRKVYAEVPPRVEYSLTPLAHTLMPHIMNLIDWAQQNMQTIMDVREQHMKEEDKK